MAQATLGRASRLAARLDRELQRRFSNKALPEQSRRAIVAGVLKAPDQEETDWPSWAAAWDVAQRKALKNKRKLMRELRASVRRLDRKIALFERKHDPLFDDDTRDDRPLDRISRALISIDVAAADYLGAHPGRQTGRTKARDARAATYQAVKALEKLGISADADPTSACYQVVTAVLRITCGLKDSSASNYLKPYVEHFDPARYQQE